MNYLISAIIINFNNEQKLPILFNSILDQISDLDEVQLIFVDDNSNDNSLKVVRNYQHSLKNLKIVKCKFNYGCSYPRNFGFKFAKGKYCTFIDSDDYLDTNYFKHLKNVILTYQPDIYLFNAWQINIQNKKIKLIKNKFPISELTKAQMINLSCYTAWTKLIKCSIMSKILFDTKQKGFEDSLFHAKLVSSHDAKRIFASDTTLYYWMNCSNSLSTKTFDNHFFTYVHDYLLKIDDIISKNKNLKQEYEFLAIRTIFSFVNDKRVVLQQKAKVTAHIVSTVKKLFKNTKNLKTFRWNKKWIFSNLRIFLSWLASTFNCRFTYYFVKVFHKLRIL